MSRFERNFYGKLKQTSIVTWCALKDSLDIMLKRFFFFFGFSCVCVLWALPTAVYVNVVQSPKRFDRSPPPPSSPFIHQLTLWLRLVVEPAVPVRPQRRRLFLYQ